MFKRLACGLVLSVMSLFASGCCLPRGGICDAGFACGDCVTDCDDTCGECQPGMCAHPWLWGRARTAMTSGAGCGDVYWGEWISDPPACGGGACGTASCGGCYGFWQPFRGLAHLWGYRYAPASCGVGCGTGYDVAYDGGCDAGCAGCVESYDVMEPFEEGFQEPLPAPKPDAEPEAARQTTAKRPAKAVRHVPASHRTTTVRRH